MAHYSRLSTRTSETPREWLSVCSQIGMQANEWAGRNDLAVYGGTDAGMGQAVACFIDSTAEIEVNLIGAFGEGATPAMVGDLRERTNQFEYPHATGVILHEAFHARHSLWNEAQLMGSFEDARVKDAFWLLEETRIEGLAVEQFPKNRAFVRASALKIAIGDVNEGMASQTSVSAFANLAGLALARVDAGVLKPSDVRVIRAKCAEVLTEDTLAKLCSIWTRFQAITHLQIEAGVALAVEWVEAVIEQSKENGEPEPEMGDCPMGGSPMEMPEGLVEALAEALAEAMDEMAISVIGDVADQEQGEKQEAEAEARKSEAKSKAKNKETAREVFSRTNNSGEASGSKSGSCVLEVRKPEGVERAGAVKLAQMLEKAKYVERSKTEVGSVIPAGRLRTRAVIQREALRSKGIMDNSPTWRKTVRKHTSDPTLTIGVMVDISGSMGSSMKPMASIAWILSEAGKRVQAKTAMVYFGSDVFATLKVGQHLDEVKVWSAPDGTEEFEKGYKAIDGALDLNYSDGVRMLVVVSDGHFRHDQQSAVLTAVKECEKNGVAVLWLIPEGAYGGGADSYLKGTHATCLKMTSTEKIADAIGKSASEALARIGGRV